MRRSRITAVVTHEDGTMTLHMKSGDQVRGAAATFLYSFEQFFSGLPLGRTINYERLSDGRVVLGV